MSAFRCPTCHGKTDVSETRSFGQPGIRRRRKCRECGRLFYTREVVSTVLDGTPSGIKGQWAHHAV